MSTVLGQPSSQSLARSECPLPPLTSVPHTPLEVNFRRLLRKCEIQAAGASDSWKSEPSFQYYVDTLLQQLSDLGSTSVSRIGPETLAQYEAHVSVLRRQLREPLVPLYCRAEQVAGAQVVTAKAQRTPAQKSVVNCATDASQDAATPQDFSTTSSEFASRMETQRNLQDDLLEDMAGLAEGLRDQTVAVEEHLKTRHGLVHAAEAGLTRSSATATANADLAGRVEQRSRSMTCYTLLVLFLVMAAFAALAVFIKVTSIAGYRAAPAKVEL